MIVKMSKYTFVLYHERQKEFLAALQELTGILLALEIDGVIAENPPGVYMALS